MPENATLQSIVDDSEGLIIDEEHDYSQQNAYGKIRFYIQLCYFPMQIVVGLPCNILILAIVIRRRLWLRHEAYLYLAAILLIDSLKLIFSYGDFWMNIFDHSLHRVIRMSVASDIVCKFWMWLATIFYTEWLHVLLLLNVCLRQQLATRSDGRGCCTSLTSKYCTLFGTRVILGSYFIACVVANFWSFASYGLQVFGESLYCHFSSGNITQHMWLLQSWWWLGLYTSWSVLAVQLSLIVWKRKRRSGFFFTRMNGESEDDGDVEVLTKIAIVCSAVTCITSASGFLHHVLDWILYEIIQPQNRFITIVVLETLHLIFLVHPLSTPIACFAVKSRLRDDLKLIVARCCSGPSCHRKLPSQPDNNDSVVLQMGQIEENSAVTLRKNDPVPVILPEMSLLA